MKPGRAVASFDSATAMVRVLSRHLHGESSPALGLGTSIAVAARALLPAVNRMPAAVRERIYALSGQAEAVPRRWLPEIDVEEVAGWLAEQYPRRRYPAVLIGSSSGALTHLAALAGLPWLPQTLLVPVRHRGVHPDRPGEAVQALATARDAFTDANPQIGLHHMHDANQDRLMIEGMAYFRYKYRRVPLAYLAFLQECLPPGGTVLVADCGQSWPTAAVGSRQVFQHGAVGGATADEYQQGGPRVADFLAEQGSPYREWDGPAPDASSPEAEWGFDPTLLPDLARLCSENGWRLERLRFAEPDTPSGAVAETYRAWYAERGQSTTRLLVDCFALMDVHLPLRFGCVPFWTTFGTRPALGALLSYLDQADPFDQIDLGLFSHGTCSIGLARADEWDQVLRRARGQGRYCGVDPQVFPQDFASNVRFHDELARRGVRSGEPQGPPWEWVRERLRQAAAVQYLTGEEAANPA